MIIGIIIIIIITDNACYKSCISDTYSLRSVAFSVLQNSCSGESIQLTIPV